MTLQQFIDKYNGKKNDFDGVFGGQCVDLYDFYCRDVVGAPIHYVNGAKDIWENYPKTYFNRIPNTPTGVPIPSSVMIWGNTYGPYGHVAIVTEANVDRFKALSQNDPIGTPTQIREYSYDHVLGWLEPVQNVNSSTPNMDSKKAIQFDRVLNYLKDKGYIADNDSNHYLDGEFLDLIKKLYEDYKSNRNRAGKWDKICLEAGFTGDSNVVTPAQIIEEVKKADCKEECQNQKQSLIAKIISLLNSI